MAEDREAIRARLENYADKDEDSRAVVKLGASERGSSVYERNRAELELRISYRITAAIDAFTQATTQADRTNKRLARVGIALNVVLVLATAVIAYGTYVLARK